MACGKAAPDTSSLRNREFSVRSATRGSFNFARILAVVLLAPSLSRAEPVVVAHSEGLAHGLLTLRSLDGTILAAGDLIQTSNGRRVTTRLVFRFKDGSTRDETTVYTQRREFRLISNHVVQKGPTFKMPMESTIDALNGQVTVRYTEDGKEKLIEEHLQLPADISNGLILALLKNISPKTPKTTVSMLAITPKPRLVKLEIVPAGEEPFSTAGYEREATHYVIKVHVPGVAGAIGSLLGKTPPDSHIWMLGGEAPVCVKSESALFPGGPTWRIDPVSPVWPPSSASTSTRSSKNTQGAMVQGRPTSSARAAKNERRPDRHVPTPKQ
jgi:hypothetical protein